MATCTSTEAELDSIGIDTIQLAPFPRPLKEEVQRTIRTADPENGEEEATPPSTAIDALQKWNYPRVNMWRVFATFWSFFVVGMNDGSYGVRSTAPIDF
jgi:hypothetical protein